MAYRSEMEVLLRRARWVHWAIILCTTCALFICMVIAALFVGSELGRDPSGTISILFIVAMIALTSGLLCFLREIALATGNIAGNAKLR
jgi:high-affinity Fe2+/Pb2+ permease